MHWTPPPPATLWWNARRDYKALADEDTLKQNSGFTLYTAGGAYRFKAIAVYYFDPSEQGAGAFDLYGSTDLSSYYDYLTFVAGIQAAACLTPALTWVTTPAS